MSVTRRSGPRLTVMSLTLAAPFAGYRDPTLSTALRTDDTLVQKTRNCDLFPEVTSLARCCHAAATTEALARLKRQQTMQGRLVMSAMETKARFCSATQGFAGKGSVSWRSSFSAC